MPMTKDLPTRKAIYTPTKSQEKKLTSNELIRFNITKTYCPKTLEKKIISNNLSV